MRTGTSYVSFSIPSATIPALAVLAVLAALAVPATLGGCQDKKSPQPTVSKTMAGEPQSGEALWTRACTHALGVFAQVTGAPTDKARRGRRACINGLKKTGGQKADEAARCFLKMKKMEDMADCMKILFPAGTMPMHGRGRR